MYRSEHPTGRCAVLITGQDRSLVTKLDAANHFTSAHLNTVLISEHFKVCYGVLKVGISLHRFHVFAVKLFVTSLPAQVKKCWGSICFLICLPAGNQSCGMRS